MPAAKNDKVWERKAQEEETMPSDQVQCRGMELEGKSLYEALGVSQDASQVLKV